MATLHMMSGQLSPHSETWHQLQAMLSADDAILFLGAGLYNLARLAALPHAMYVLQTDVTATGFQPAACVTVIDYEAFVGLGVRYERSLSWN